MKKISKTNHRDRRNYNFIFVRSVVLILECVSGLTEKPIKPSDWAISQGRVSQLLGL